MRGNKLRGAAARLRGKVVVITGASSGIGRAAALEFAAAGCHVVLAARRVDALHDVAERCRRLGAAAHVVETDVTIESDIRRLRDVTLARWGRIDVWVNNAGTTYFARLDEGELEAHRRVIETNLIGPVMAARLVLPVYRRQRAGTLINIGSVLSQVGQTFVPAYVISKFGLRGLSEAIRADVAEIPGIQVCTVLPFAVDTPHFEDAGNATGKRAYAMPFVQEPEAVARVIVDVAARPRRQAYVPRYIAAGIAVHWLWPHPVERVLHRALRKFHLVGRQAQTQGNLFSHSGTKGATHGTRRPVIGRTLFTAWLVGQVAAVGVHWLRSSLARQGDARRPLEDPRAAR